jgi:integrase/recombinase XerD
VDYDEAAKKKNNKGTITDENERHKLEYLIKTKKWNPYCIRHSAITNDSDFLPEYALRKKVRWSMNSRQPSRYIKSRMGDSLKEQILAHNGIISEQQTYKRPTISVCSRCKYANAVDTKYCAKCSYPLNSSAFEEIKLEEQTKLQAIQQMYEKDIESLRSQLLSMQQEQKELRDVVRRHHNIMDRVMST